VILTQNQKKNEKTNIARNPVKMLHSQNKKKKKKERKNKKKKETSEDFTFPKKKKKKKKGFQVVNHHCTSRGF